jgi:hypothetical protein
MAEMKKYVGGCHCGKVRYAVTMAPVKGAMACNCSICSKRGTLLTFVPAGQFELTSGEGSLTDYQFGKKNIHHLFCPVCGVASYATGKGPDGTQMMAINVRCLDDLDVSTLSVSTFDGKSL